MSEPLLIFETDSQLGIPRLQSLNGAAKTWGLKDLGQLEELLRPRYEGLVRDGSGAIEYRGKWLQVKRKEGDVSRQPTLELRLEEPVPAWPGPVNQLVPKSNGASAAWGAGFLAEVDRLFAGNQFESVLPVEKAMLNLVRDELRQLLDQKPPAQTAQLVLVSMLMTAEHLSRTQRPNEPHPYAIALSGMEKLLGQATQPPQTPWGTLPVGPNLKPPPSWVGRFWQRVTHGR